MNFKRKKQRRSNKFVSCSFCCPSIGLDKEQLRVAEEEIKEATSDPMFQYFKWREDEIMDFIAMQFGSDEWDQYKRHEHT